MTRLVIAALLAATMGGSAFAQTTTPAAPDTGEQIKDGAIKAGTAIKDGAIKVGETVTEGAVDLWESSKAAVAAGSETFNKRRAVRDGGRDPDAK